MYHRLAGFVLVLCLSQRAVNPIRANTSMLGLFSTSRHALPLLLLAVLSCRGVIPIVFGLEALALLLALRLR